jgi:zinc protease
MLDREWQWLLHGEEHVSSRYLTARRLAALDRRDLIEFHARYWQPANFVVTVAGDVEPRKVLARLDSLLAAWPGRGQPVPWPPPPASHRPAAGLYAVSIPAAQAQVAVGHLGEAWDGHWSDPERYAVEVLTEVAAGNLFISRLGRRLRGSEGLVYGIESTSGIGPTWPGSFQIRFACDPAKVAGALVSTYEELRRLRDEPVGVDELAAAKSALVAGLSGGFAAPRDTVVTFAVDDLLGWPHEFWRGYRDRLLAVSAAEVQQAARRLLQPDEMVTLVVGSWPAAAGAEGGRPPVHQLPLRDPLSLEALPAVPSAAPAPGSP